MAERRMFAKSIIDSDHFLEMPQSSQLLYFHLSMRADDEGFINNPRSIMRNVGCKDDDMKLLIAKQYIIPFESGIVVIRHWRVHNYIQKDRFIPTKCQDEKKQLEVDDNKVYTECIQSVSEMDTQVRLGKVRLGKDSNTAAAREDADSSDDRHRIAVSEIVKRLESAFARPISQVEIETMIAWIDIMPTDVICLAIDESALNNAKKVSYVNAVLRSWHDQGIKTAEQADEQRKARGKRQQRQQKQEIIPQWKQEQSESSERDRSELMRMYEERTREKHD